MKSTVVFLCFMVMGMSYAQQYNLGIGVRAGASNFLGDIGSGNLARGFIYNMELRDTRWSTGVYSRYRFSDLFVVQASFDYSRIQGTDANSANRARLGRNLNFKNDLFQLSAKLEMHPRFLSITDVGYRWKYQMNYQTYFFAGVGGTFHSPKTKYNGVNVNLRPLRTEGVKYSRAVLTLPFGGGFYFTYRRIHRFDFEYAWNWTFTDYLDDISSYYVDPSQMAPDELAPILANRYSGEGDVPGPAQYGLEVQRRPHRP